MLPDLSRLTVFYQVYQSRNFKAAGEALHITQSAVSQHIKKLENEIGHKLFVRSRHHVIPLTAAERLYEVVQPFIEKLKGSLGNLNRLKEAPGGVLRIGAPVEFGSKFLTRVIASFLKEHPAVHFELQFGSRDTLCDLLAENRLDLAFTDVFSDKNPIASIFAVKPIITEHLLLVGTPLFLRSHELTANPPLLKLSQAPHLSYLLNYPDLKNWYRLHFKNKTPDLNIWVTVENVQAMIHLVLESVGLGLVPDYLIETELKTKTLLEITPSAAKITNKISLVQLRDKTPSTTEKVFIRFFLNSR